MKKQSLQTSLFSVVGVLAMLLILVAFNFIAGRFKARADLTVEHAYTLSAGTKAILAKLDTPVQIRFYCSQNERAMPVFLKTYAQQAEDLLGEYRQNSHGMIEIQKLDPEPDSDAEDSAKIDGVEGQQLSNGERIYLGVSVSMVDQKQVVPFLAPDRERLLEYDISRAIARVVTPDRPVVGVMSSLSIMGSQTPPMPTQPRSQQNRPWVFISELRRDYTVKQVEMTAETIPDEIKVLVVIHPKAISPTTQFALDQFVLRGGKLIAFLDPRAVLDRDTPTTSGMMPPPSTSNLDTLLKAWGLSFDSSKVLADMSFVATTRQGRAPTVLVLNEKAINKDDIVTADAGNLIMAFSGVFAGNPVAGLKETVLLHSSKESELVDPMTAQMDGEEVAKNFQPSEKEYALALRLSGKFPTAFPNGKPTAAGAKPDEKKAPDTSSLKESKVDSVVVLVGDSDMVQDQLSVREIQNPLGQPLFLPANGNLAFAQNLVDQLSGDSNLIAVRSRASRERPFTVVKKLQEDAEANYRSKIKGLEASLAEAQRKIGELQQNKESGQRFILSPEQQQELANFRKTEADVKLQLKDVRKHLRAEIDSLETRIKWLNIAGMPAIVALAGIGFAIMKRKNAGAR